MHDVRFLLGKVTLPLPETEVGNINMLGEVHESARGDLDFGDA